MPKRILILIVSSLLIAACAHSGNRALYNMTREKISATLINGITTKAEVKSIFGIPCDTDQLENGQELWKYQYKNVTVKASTFIPIAGSILGGVNEEIKTLKITFSSEGKVMKHSFHNNKGETKMGY